MLLVLSNPTIDSVVSVEYIFTIARGPTAPPRDHGVVAVIDGQQVKITPLVVANIPPPMALHEISVPSPALDVVVGDNGSIAVLHRDGVSLFTNDSISASSPPPVLKRQLAFKKTGNPQNFHQAITFAPNNEVLVLRRSPVGSIITLYSLNDDSSTTEEDLSESSRSIVSTLSSFTEDGLTKPFTQDRSGALCSALSASRELSYGSFASVLPWVEIVSHGDTHIAFGMSASGQLYANSRLLVKNCTSFVVTPAHLIFTTTTHLIKFVHITDVNSMLNFPTLSSILLTLQRFRNSTGRPGNRREMS
jgi:elongator complex protein 1